MGDEKSNEFIEGGCYCGDLQYQVQLPVKWCAHCHCSQCRHTQGAPIVTWFGVDVNNFKIIRGDDALRWYSSSETAERGHCSHCGSPLFFKGERWPNEMHITRESTQDNILIKPKVHVFYNRRVDYLQLDDDLDKYGGTNGVTPLPTE